MKRIVALSWILICIFALFGCNKNIDPEKPVFETENISKITLFWVNSRENGIEVPSEYIEEVTAWIASFRVDKKAGDLLDPGTNSLSFKIEYNDGTVVKSGANTTVIDGVTYYMNSSQSPECFEVLFEQSRLPEN